MMEMSQIYDKQARLYRAVSAPLAPPMGAAAKRLDSKYYVEGYATTFARYLLWDFDGVKYYEEIAPDAFEGAEMADVIMQYDHRGKVLARQSNGTLVVEPDGKGLFVCADLSKSAAAKELYEEIGAGLITQMSWAFTVAGQSFEQPDEKTRVRKIEKIERVYDVSAVSIPANGDTEILARSLGEWGLQAGKSAARARLLKLKINLIRR